MVGKLKEKMKGDTGRCLALYVLFFLVIFAIHLPWEIVSDDKHRIKQTYDSVFSLLITNYMTKTGKYLSETIGIVSLKMPFVLWKIIDSLVWCIIAECLHYISGIKKMHNRIVVCICILLFPFSWLDSAGYVMTSSNYIYPFLGLLMALIQYIKYMWRRPG